jgi:hypothetical protein
VSSTIASSVNRRGNERAREAAEAHARSTGVPETQIDGS